MTDGGQRENEEGGVVGQQHLLDENMGLSVPAKLLGLSLVTSSSGHWRPDQTFTPGERGIDGERGGTRSGVGHPVALKIQEGAIKQSGGGGDCLPSTLLWTGTDLWRTDQKEHKERFVFNNSVSTESSG